MKDQSPAKLRQPEGLSARQVKALLAATKGELLTLILLGVRTGQRVRDIPALRRGDIDIIRFHVTKHDEVVYSPMTPELRSHLAQAIKDAPGQLVLPSLMVAGRPPEHEACADFATLAEKVGIHQSFHSLRKTCVTKLES